MNKALLVRAQSHLLVKTWGLLRLLTSNPAILLNPLKATPELPGSWKSSLFDHNSSAKAWLSEQLLIWSDTFQSGFLISAPTRTQTNHFSPHTCIQTHTHTFSLSDTMLTRQQSNRLKSTRQQSNRLQSKRILAKSSTEYFRLEL